MSCCATETGNQFLCAKLTSTQTVKVKIIDNILLMCKVFLTAYLAIVHVSTQVPIEIANKMVKGKAAVMFYETHAAGAMMTIAPIITTHQKS
jgi:hypothetical protein